jgi:hypothetical protein
LVTTSAVGVTAVVVAAAAAATATTRGGDGSRLGSADHNPTTRLAMVDTTSVTRKWALWRGERGAGWVGTTSEVGVGPAARPAAARPVRRRRVMTLDPEGGMRRPRAPVVAASECVATNQMCSTQSSAWRG